MNTDSLNAMLLLLKEYKAQYSYAAPDPIEQSIKLVEDDINNQEN